jgi:uncharacterized protein YndB with AHSA1/START domain
MSLKKEASGRRSVQVEVEVPGTPEQVWQAIATGPGITSWFVPTEFREDGTVSSYFGPGMDSLATITEWQPPHRFVTESADFGPDAPPIATEWSVAARSGGTCTVRVVHSFFAGTDEWDDQLEGFESGWPWFFRVLRLALTHFQGQPCAPFRVMSTTTTMPIEEAWDALTGSLGLSAAALGQQAEAGEGVPSLAGHVERVQTYGGGHPHGLQLLLDRPAPGIFAMFAHAFGGQVLLVLDFYFYGDQAAAIATREQPQWQAWMTDHFPAITEPVTST